MLSPLDAQSLLSELDHTGNNFDCFQSHKHPKDK